jgi:WW domain-containing oxidoreductase
MPSLTGNSFDPDKDIPNLKGKTYLVTGGSAGIGFGICAHLLQHHARIILLSNKEDHAQEAMEELKEWGDVGQVEWVKCDLANLKETDRVAKAILGKESELAGVSS